MPLGREPLCPMFSWVKARTHYDILIPDGVRSGPAYEFTQALRDLLRAKANHLD